MNDGSIGFHDGLPSSGGTRALHTEIKAAGYDGGYSAVTDFVRAWRQGEGQAVNVTAFVPLTFELGEAFQFDWSEEGLVVGGIYYRMQVSHLKRKALALLDPQ